MNFIVIFFHMSRFATMVTPLPSFCLLTVIVVIYEGPTSNESITLRVKAEYEDLIITFLLLCSHLTSEKSSWMLSNGLIPITLPQTSSRSLLKSRSNLNVFVCSTIFGYKAKSWEHFHEWVSNRLSCFHWGCWSIKSNSGLLDANHVVLLQFALSRSL